jgi:plastocyanin
LGLVALALVVSLPLWLVTRSTVDAEVAAGLQEVTATNFVFEDVAVGAGESIVVRNTDPFHHTFTIDELGIDVDLLPGEAVVVALPDSPGTYTYYCVPHSFDGGNGADDMAATLALE